MFASYPLSLVFLSLRIIAVASQGLRVLTAQGPVIGTQVHPRVRQWLGVPFATAARWTAPSQPATRVGNFKARAYGPSCYQLANPTAEHYLQFAHQDDAITEGEDCLTVNIWAPSVNRPQNTAVLIWIHGGGFQFGTSALAVQDGRFFVRDSDDLIIVTLNYRLNIFGQPNAPQLVHPTNSQNFGLLDQKAAIEWVKDNIAAFGGNPNRISIFGQSAGATSADIYAQSYPSDTSVKGIILQSGSISGLNNLASPTLDTIPWETVAVAVGCGSSPTPAQFTCMQGIPAAALRQAALDANLSFKIVTDGKSSLVSTLLYLTWPDDSLVVYLHPDIVVFADWASRMASGNFLKVPTIIGTVQHEGDAFTVAGHIATRGNAPAVVTSMMADVFTQIIGTCPPAAAAKERVDNGVTTWRYQYQAIWPGISTRQDLRAFHGSDIPIIFGTFESIHTGTLAERALSQFVKNSFSTFARNPSSGLTSGSGWPTYNPSADTLVQLGNVQNPTGSTLGSPTLIDATCPHSPALRVILGSLTSILNSIP